MLDFESESTSRVDSELMQRVEVRQDYLAINIPNLASKMDENIMIGSREDETTVLAITPPF